MKVEFHSLYWPNTNPSIPEYHSKVMKHFDIPVNYSIQQIDHGQWMDSIMNNTNADIIVFFDIDCIPTDYERMIDCIKYVKKNHNFLGIAQVSNHIKPASHIYAAPAFLIIYKNTWDILGRPSFRATQRGDVAEELSYVAEDLGLPYRCLYPTCFESTPQEGNWKLGNYGWYGIGTVFEDTVFHLYQSRLSENIGLFKRCCNMVIDGTFETYYNESFMSSVDKNITKSAIRLK